MNKVISFALIFVLVIQISCKEEIPDKVFETILLDTTYVTNNIPQVKEKKILIEEFTGASCINCPDGHKKLKEIKSQYGDRINIISLHQGGLATPAKGGEEDLRTGEAESIAADFGVSAIPAALIDRVESSGDRVFSRTIWNSKIQDRLSAKSPFNINITTRFDNNSQNYVLNYKIIFTEEYNIKLKYYISILEDDVKVTQKDGSNYLSDYPQNHTLRKMLTGYTGVGLDFIEGAKYEKGRVIEKENEISIDNKWNKDHVEIAVFLTDENNSEVVNSEIIKLK